MRGSRIEGLVMTHLHLLSCGPLLILSLGGWWRHVEAQLRPVAQVDPLAPGEVPLAELVREVLWQLDGTAARHFARLDMAVAEDLTIAGDRQIVHELLSMLCLHAIHSTPCGTILVTARLHGEEVAVRIVDDGMGVATTRTVQIMQRTREMLALLGGRIENLHHEGAGSSVTVLLPAYAPPWNAMIATTMAQFARVTAPRDAASARFAARQPS